MTLLDLTHHAPFCFCPQNLVARKVNPAQKVGLLENALDKTDSVRFFIQILWELHLISNTQYIDFGGEIENIGKMLGGWKKGIIAKTSAIKAEERK